MPSHTGSVNFTGSGLAPLSIFGFWRVVKKGPSISNEVEAPVFIASRSYGEAALQSLTRLSRVAQLSPHLGKARTKFVVIESRTALFTGQRQRDRRPELSMRSQACLCS
jgi:hypothetical protein